MFFNKHKTTIIVCILTLFGFFLHFYNMNWGAPFYFHPDERNIASSVTNIQLPDKMNPQFFAYGSLPIYTIYFTAVIKNYLVGNQTTNVLFEEAIVVSRLYSVIFATLLIPILFFIGKKIKDEKVGITAAFLATFSTGFIQFSHFGTFEMWLTFFSILLFWISLEKITWKTNLISGVIIGVLVAVKISSLALLIIPFALLLKKHFRHVKKKLTSIFLHLRDFVFNFLLLIIIAGVVYFATNPFVILDTLSFKNSMNYETSLALGNLPVFYTGEFFNTIPVLFQFGNIYPFLLNPLVTYLFLLAFFYLFILYWQTKQTSFFLLLAFFLILFLSQAFLFAKWTRYMVPTLPFIYLIISVAFWEFIKTKISNVFTFVLLGLFGCVSILFSISYFITVFVRPDTRIEAGNLGKQLFTGQSIVLSEVYDLGIVPFNETPARIDLFNFYDLETNVPESNLDALNNKLRTTEYIILPSPRILKTRLINKHEFPKGNAFYLELINNNLGYKKVYETPCDIFCKIIYLGDPVFSYEQTAHVFDRPTVMIFKKDLLPN